MRNKPSAWCAPTPRNGASIPTRSASWASRRGRNWRLRQRSCLRTSTRRTATPATPWRALLRGPTSWASFIPAPRPSRAIAPRRRFRAMFRRHSSCAAARATGFTRSGLKSIFVDFVDLFKFFQRKPFHFLEHEQNPIRLRNRSQQRLHGFPDLLPVLLFVLHLPPCRGISQHHLLLGQVRHAEFLAPALLPKVIVSGA